MGSLIRKYAYYASSALQLCFKFKPLSLVLKIFSHRVPPGQYLIEIPSCGVKLFVRGIMDIWSAKETFVNRFYEKYGTSLQDGWTIVDIGGGIGDFTIFAMKSFPNNRVLAFEPTLESFNLLNKNLSLNSVDQVQAFNKAIWSCNGQIELDMSQGEPGQFTSQNVGQRNNLSKVLVPCMSLSEIFIEQNIKNCDLMKIDAEGAEYPILYDTPDEVFAKIERIVMEYHDIDAQHTVHELEKFLQTKGYRVRSTVNVVHHDLGYLYACRNHK